MDGFVKEAEKGCKLLDQPALRALHARARPKRLHRCASATTTRARSPTTGPMPRTSRCRTTCSSRRVSWSLPEHLYLVSAWSAACPLGDENPLDCVSTPQPPAEPRGRTSQTDAWTDITYLMYGRSVSWRYYVFEGQEPDCESRRSRTCKPPQQSATTPGIWNPLQDFTDVKQDGQRENIQSLTTSTRPCTKERKCGLANVSWVDAELRSLRTPAVDCIVAQDRRT